MYYNIVHDFWFEILLKSSLYEGLGDLKLYKVVVGGVGLSLR